MHIPRLTIALLLGAASVLAFAPMGGFPLIWLTLGGLYALLEKQMLVQSELFLKYFSHKYS